MQQGLCSIGQWTRDWGMQFNEKKCYIISTVRYSEGYSHPYFYQLNGHVLKGVPPSPYLGILLSEDLTFSTHISNITKKASRMLGFLCRNLSGCPVALKETAYFSLVCFNLKYAAAVCDSFIQSDINNLQIIQR